MIYFDNGATSFPKAPGVADAMVDYICNVGVNVGRGSYKEAYRAGGVVFDCREKLLGLFNAGVGSEAIFTKNVTESLNVILKGYLKAGDHVVISSLEHNAVMRTLRSLEKKGVEISKAPCSHEGETFAKDIRREIRENTKLIIITHASNVCGTINNIGEIGELAWSMGIPLVVDAAQTAGAVEIDMKKWKASAVCFTGHKALLGPQGIGGFVITPDFALKVETLIDGGTGSASDSEDQPEILPDKFESGTQNIPGIYGLNAALDYIETVGIEEFHRKEMKLTKKLLDGLEDFEKAGVLRVVGRKNTEGRTAAVSVDFLTADNADVAYSLDEDYDIKVRVGMHCAPSAHKALGTFPQGTVRFSFSCFNEENEVERLLEVIGRVVEVEE